MDKNDSNAIVCQTYRNFYLYSWLDTSQLMQAPANTQPSQVQPSIYLVYCPCPHSPLWWYPDPGCPSSAWHQSTPLLDSLLLHHCNLAAKNQTQQSIKIWNIRSVSAVDDCKDNACHILAFIYSVKSSMSFFFHYPGTQQCSTVFLCFPERQAWPLTYDLTLLFINSFTGNWVSFHASIFYYT